MVQLPSQNESKKPRVGQLRETGGEQFFLHRILLYSYTRHTLSHTTPHTHTLHSLTYTPHTQACTCTPAYLTCMYNTQTTHSLTHHTHTLICTPHTHTPSPRSPSHEATQGAQGMALPSWRDASLSCPPHTRAEGGAGGSLRQSYHVQELQEGRTA